MFYKFLFIVYKNEWFNLWSKKQRRDTIYRAKDYYENDRERLREQAKYK